MTLFSHRLPHVLTRADLAYLLAPTYAREAGVDEDLAHERMTEALSRPALVEQLQQAVSAALVAAQGERSEDAVMDLVAKRLPKLCAKMKAAPAGPALAAVAVWLNIELGLAPESLRATLESDKGRALLTAGFRTLGEFWVRELVR